MRALRLVVAIFLATLLTGMGAAPGRTAIEGSYTLTDVGTLGGASSTAAAVNDAGQLSGTSDLPQTGADGLPVRHAFLWTSNLITDLGTLGGVGSEAYGLNARGQVTGRAQGADGRFHAFLWTPTSANGTAGTMVALGELPGHHSSTATDVNDFGQVVGVSFGPGLRAEGFLWTPDAEGGTAGTLTSLGAVFPNAINTAGQVAGSTNTPGQQPRPFLWTPSTPRGTTGTIADLGLAEGAAAGDAFDVNDAGQVVGYDIFLPGGNFTGFIHTGTARSTLPSLGGSNSAGAGLSEPREGISGPMVVGYAYTSGGSAHAALFQDREVRDLNELASQAPSALQLGALLTEAVDVSRRLGNIACTAVNEAGARRAVFARKEGDVLELELTRIEQLEVGDTFTWTLRVTNVSEVGATDVNVTFSFGNHLALVSSEVQPGRITLNGERVQVANLETLPAGESWEMRFTLKALRPGEADVAFDAGGTIFGSSFDQLGPSYSLEIVEPSPDDVTEQTRVTPARQRKRGNRVTQTVSITNTGGTSVGALSVGDLRGPLYLVLDNLQGGTLLRGGGVTRNVEPLGSPYVKLPGRKLKAGKSVKATLQFRPTAGATGPITYQARVLAGKGAP